MGTTYDEFIQECQKESKYDVKNLDTLRYNARFDNKEDPIIAAAEMGIKFIHDSKEYDPIVYAIETGLKLEPLPGNNKSRKETDPIKYAVENNLKIEGKNALDFLLNTEKGNNALKQHTEQFLRDNKVKEPQKTEKKFLESIGINSELKDPNLAKRILNKVSFGKLFRESVAKKEALEYLSNHAMSGITPAKDRAVKSTIVRGHGNNNQSKGQER